MPKELSCWKVSRRSAETLTLCVPADATRAQLEGAFGRAKVQRAADVARAAAAARAIEAGQLTMAEASRQIRGAA